MVDGAGDEQSDREEMNAIRRPTTNAGRLFLSCVLRWDWIGELADRKSGGRIVQVSIGAIEGPQQYAMEHDFEQLMSRITVDERAGGG